MTTTGTRTPEGRRCPDCFVRLQVIDASGSVDAFGQPTWGVLKTAPDTGIPTARQTPD